MCVVVWFLVMCGLLSRVNRDVVWCLLVCVVGVRCCCFVVVLRLLAVVCIVAVCCWLLL